MCKTAIEIHKYRDIRKKNLSGKEKISPKLNASHAVSHPPATRREAVNAMGLACGQCWTSACDIGLTSYYIFLTEENRKIKQCFFVRHIFFILILILFLLK
jgi:hypothetical protein